MPIPLFNEQRYGGMLFYGAPSMCKPLLGIRSPFLHPWSFSRRKRCLDPTAFPAPAELFPHGGGGAPLHRLQHPFCRRNAFDARVDHRCFIERPPERLKHRFDHMVRIAPVMDDDMQVHPRFKRQFP